MPTRKKNVRKRAAAKSAKPSRPATQRKRTTAKSAREPDLLEVFAGYRKAPYAEKAGKLREASLDALRDAYLHKGLVLYVGAGASQSVGLPNWSELIRSLTVLMMRRRVEDAMSGLEPDSDAYWEALHAMQMEVEKGTGSNKPILMMARAIKDELGSGLPSLVARTLYATIWPHVRRRFSAPDKNKRRSRFVDRNEQLPSSGLLDALVALARAERDVSGVHAIVNYNYDDLLDQRLLEEKVRSMTVRSGHDKVSQGTLPCYHVHGVLSLDRLFTDTRLRDPLIGNFVFSEDEYHEEYSDPYRWSNMTQVSLLGRYTGLFVGLSMEDPNIRRLIDVTHRQYPDVVNYAILTRKSDGKAHGDSKASVLRNLFEEVETDSFKKIGVRVLWVDKHDEVPALLHKICETGGREPAAQQGVAPDDSGSSAAGSRR